MNENEWGGFRVPVKANQYCDTYSQIIVINDVTVNHNNENDMR